MGRFYFAVVAGCTYGGAALGIALELQAQLRQHVVRPVSPMALFEDGCYGAMCGSLFGVGAPISMPMPWRHWASHSWRAAWSSTSTSLILTTQDPQDLKPEMRSSLDYVFLTGSTNEAYRRRLYEGYGGVFPSFAAFCEALDQVCKDYRCLVIDNTKTRLEDAVFWYKKLSTR